MKKVLSLALAVLMMFSFAACSADNKDETVAPKEKVNVNAFVLSGPTGIGAVNMMEDAKNGIGLENYNFNVVAAPDEIVAKISNGEADIAAVATNLAAKLYKVTDGGIKILAVNTLGVLNVLNYKGEAVSSLADLKGRTIYTTGQGANPEYIIDYLLSENGINPDSDVKIEYKAEGTDLVPVWETDPEAVIIAPQPVATSIKIKYEGSTIALDLTDEWKKVSPDSQLMMGCIVVRNEFLNANPEAVEAFLTDYEASVKKATENVEATATLCEQYGIVAKAPIAKAAIPNCNLCFITGDEMKTQLTGYLEVLLKADPKSIGGAVPGDDFWYDK